MNRTGIKLPRSLPSAEGIDANGVMKFIDEAEKLGIELHSLMMIKNGKVAVEGWWSPYAENLRHGCYSVTKTFTATAVGFAVSEGLLSLSDKLIDFFPDKVPSQPCEHLKALTVRDMLCMACGQAAEVDIAETDDAVRAFMGAEFPVKPGTVFNYNSIASHMLAEIIFHLTGKSLPEYLTPRLFKPLGIMDIRWDKTPQGLEMGGWGIHLKTEDLAKMGLLFLQHGQWNGQQIVPESWILEASSKQIDNSPGAPAPDWGAGYCYQMWRNAIPNSYRLDGAYGQLSFVYPDRNAVIAITSAESQTERLFELVNNYLFPALKTEPLHQTPADEALCQRLCGLRIDEKLSADHSPLEAEISGKVIEFDENSGSLIPVSQRWMAFEREFGIHKAKLFFAHNICLFSWSEGLRENSVKIGLDGNYAESMTELAFALNPIRSVGAFTGDTFFFTMRAIEEPHALKAKLSFSGDSVTLSYCDALGTDNDAGWHTVRGRICE